MRGYRMSDFPWKGWEIKDGALKTIPDGEASDIITNKKFQDFELELEWKLEPGGNSGIFYFAQENNVQNILLNFYSYCIWNNPCFIFLW